MQALIFQTECDRIPPIMNTFKSKILIPFILILCFSCSLSKKDEGSSRTILVSIAPYKFFVERIAGDTVTVQQMVPTGSSPHSYEPSSRSILKASKADAWFRIGESFEKRAKQAMLSHNNQMIVVDLREGVNGIHTHEGHGHGCHHEDCIDPHIWLSPREGKKQAQTIYKTLVKLYPENKDQYHQSLKKFEKELDDLDLELEQILLPLRGKTILVSHPALGYMGRDYNFKQLSIEFEGKEPSPQQLTKLLEMGRQLKTDRIFIQEQHLSKGARLVANELNADVMELDPLSDNYIENLRFIARSISGKPQR
ncbi:ABC-type transporter, substrate-binding lipoprotein [Waddlia chondrophila WSU 86-1044]|uniref:ABC-type transporter, substrate-binding lipoprotein n=2 Tax=Waddlia chondrophila TaxID=71667 RepID=D6YSR5_WADCW|nr:ABC-type transporter, substrate-binding lipoprotein [Waddlia chondrophila WSU 86-1044]